ncbi:protein of unknown function [Georgenia satyanarayanai]|uniref:DUF4192 domain-containing protein n=1 Tax=Georgenia satyanarayanai TaxID=860221 RepID=A0A2Y9C7V0_9MICO|nr:DUF4192 family protein [Georgenia satyanarayanai]PYF96342.1 uncharacterized protein DUF4192 [Georgenia satyanarayanai]SSA46863.1 protein of unknown function [Georgenia satyanarayanai]
MSEQRDALIARQAAVVAGAIPYRLEYQPSDDQVAIATITDGHLGPVAAVSWDSDVINDAMHARWMAGRISHAFAGAKVDHFIPVGYGPHAHERAVLLCGAFAEYGNAHLGIVVDREANTARVIDPILGPADTTYELVPPAEYIASGVPAPEASREDLLLRYQPHPAPTYPPAPDRVANTIATTLPSARRVQARALLEDLTRPKVEHRPEDLSRLAHLALSHKLVRDSLLTDAGRSHAKTHLLVDLYRGAPEDYRSGLATLAAASLYLNGNSVGTEEVLNHADRFGDHSRLTELVETGHALGVRPPAVDELAGDLAAAAERADTAFKREQTSGLHGASFPAQPTTDPGKRRGNDPGRRPPAAGPEPDLDR